MADDLSSLSLSADQAAQAVILESFECQPKSTKVSATHHQRPRLFTLVIVLILDSISCFAYLLPPNTDS